MVLRKKKLLSVGIALAMVIQVLPVKVFATTKTNDNLSKEAVDFTLFTSSKDTPLTIEGNSANIKGDIHSNNDFFYSGSSISIEGVSEAVNNVNLKTSQSTVESIVEGAKELDMPNYTEDIRLIMGDDIDKYDSNKKFNKSNLLLSKSIIVEGNLDISSSKFMSKGYILSKKDINISSAIFETGKDNGVVIVSEEGNITINGSLAKMKGIIYAPKGTVTINSADFDLNGRIIADKIIFRGSSFKVTSSLEDYQLITGVKIEEDVLLNIEKVDKDFKLNWNFVKNAGKYSVVRKIDNGEYTVIADNLTNNYYTDNSFEAKGIYSYKVIASNKNENKESNEVSAYVSDLGNGLLLVDSSYKDTDGDGLTDFLEDNKYFSNSNVKDTDGDGIKDGDEVYKLFTDPIKVDTDGNGITDDKEDFDNDKINNLDEILNNTDPWLDDTDLDKLSDYDEIYTYNTDPNKEDTDEDGLMDGNEIIKGTNPLIMDTDGDSIKDGDEIFSITILTDEIEKDGKVEPEISIDVEGKNMDNITISNIGSSNPYLQSDIPGYIGAPYEFSSPTTFNSANIKFKFQKELLNEVNFEPAIYYFNEETKLLELLPNQKVNLDEGTVSTEVSHFSTYILLNKKDVDEVWAKEMKEPFEGEIENIELVIGFSIDSSGSMSWNDPYGLRKQTAKEFVEKMDDNDKAAVIDFDDSAKVNCSLTSDKTAIKNAIDRIDSSGGTDLGVGIKASLEQLKWSTSKAKFIIMLTDGEGSYDHSLTQKAINDGVKIYTIGLGSSVDVSLLKGIAEATGGKYYHASTAGDLEGIFDETSGETVDLTKDTDKDGISDYHEKRGVRTSTGWIYTDYNNPDTDGDGVKDGEELKYRKNYFIMISDPTKKDSDNDGILDNLDPEPMVYSITDRTLSLAAGLSYTNLNSSIGQTVGSRGEEELSDFKIIGANDCGFLTFQEFFDEGLGSVTIKVSRPGQKDAIIYAIRGTEFSTDPLNDGITDLYLGLGKDTVQSKKAFKEYKKLAKKYPNSDFFLSGHSLGGRLVQDVLYEVYDANDGTLGFFKSNITEPIHSATFNALGYNKKQYFTNWLFKQSNVEKINNRLYNYYFNKDLVGEGLGNSLLFERLGTEMPGWTATDADGNDIPTSSWLPYEFAKLHGIDLFYSQGGLKYPNSTIY